MFSIKYKIDPCAKKELADIKSPVEFEKNFSVINGMIEITMDDFSEGWYYENNDTSCSENIRRWAAILFELKNQLLEHERACFNLWEGECRFFCFELLENYVYITVCAYDFYTKESINFIGVKEESPIEKYQIIYKTDVKLDVFCKEIDNFLRLFRDDILKLNKNIPLDFKW